ncbi:uncharacterized protein LOC135340978 [Halichondria panicea]|uniref:uncharacterized protein LOC135340978 n=1 Tax=Halichondria panicea TaxID=6063 RepID=UPI00312BB636
MLGLRRYCYQSTPQHKVSGYDKFVLRITGLSEGVSYNSISIERMEKANSRFRIGLMFLMMGFSVAGSVYAVMLGKRDRAEHVHSVTQQNIERHAKAKAKSLQEK